MLKRSKRLSTVTVLLLVAACQKGGPRTLRDSEGRIFSAVCDGQHPCKIQQKQGPERRGKPAQALLVGSRLVGICDVKEGEAPAGPFDCRPLACNSDADCPPLHGMRDGQCLNERCSDPAEALGVSDAIMLCLAGTGLGRETPAQVERYALALNCGQPCRVPAPCPQP
jgi:hypothetical protein